MSLKSWLFGDFIDKIEWKDNTKDRLFYKFPLDEKEVSYNAKLKVKEGEVAIFAINSKVFDSFTFGDYIVNKDTIPNIANALNWDSSYDEPLNVDIYFINRESFTFKWNTKEPILLHDKDNSIAKLEASGEFELHIFELKLFIDFILSEKSDIDYTLIITSIFDKNIVDALINRKSSIFNLARDKEEFSQFIYAQIMNSFTSKGLILDRVLINHLDVEQELPSFTGIYDSDEDSINTDSKIYYIIKNSKADGPYSKNDILRFIKEDKLIAASYIWKDGLKSWVKVKDIFDLESI